MQDFCDGRAARAPIPAIGATDAIETISLHASVTFAASNRALTSLTSSLRTRSQSS